jgi:hypothetical protein
MAPTRRGHAFLTLRCAITRLHAKSSKSVSGAPARILRQWQLHIAMVAIGILVLFVEKISPPL